MPKLVFSFLVCARTVDREHCGGAESEHKFAFVKIFPRGNATKPKKFHFCPIAEGYFRHKVVPHFAKYAICVIAIAKLSS